MKKTVFALIATVAAMTAAQAQEATTSTTSTAPAAAATGSTTSTAPATATATDSTAPAATTASDSTAVATATGSSATTSTGFGSGMTGGRAYVGVGAAFADHTYKLPGATNIHNDGFKASGKLFGGYNFTDTWGVEAGYTDFRKADATFGLNGTQTSAQSEGHASYLAAKATAPLTGQVSVYGKAGWAHNKATLASANPAAQRDRSTDSLYGAVGLEYKLNQQVGLVAEYERYGKQKQFGHKADVFTVGAKYNF